MPLFVIDRKPSLAAKPVVQNTCGLEGFKHACAHVRIFTDLVDRFSAAPDFRDKLGGNLDVSRD
jgi:hypothetical protein